MRYTWDLSLLCTDGVWKDKYDKLNEMVDLANNKLENFLDNVDLFLDFIHDYIRINEEIEVIYCYPRRNLDIDLNNEKYKEMFKCALDLYQKILLLISDFENKLMDNCDIVYEYLKDKRCLKHKRYIGLILRRSKHILKDKSYKLNYETKLQDIKSGYQNLFNNGFEVDLLLGDRSVTVNRFNYNDLMIDKNQVCRKKIFDAYTSEYEKFNDIFANLYLDKLKNDISLSKAEGYSSLLSKKLFELELDDSTFLNLISKVNKNLDIMHDFKSLKKEILGLNEFHFYDTSLSVCSIPKVEYKIEDAIKLIKESLRVLGNDRILIIDKMFNEGWVDVFPRKDKRSNSYTCISFSGVPYILTNFDGSINSIRTLAHEIGHAFNVYYSKNNGFEYFEFSYFLTEIASKVKELLFNEYMLSNFSSKEEKVYILNNVIESLTNSLFGQVMLTEFEFETVKKLENNEVINKDFLNDLYLSICKKYNGSSMIYDDNVKYGWCKIPHYFVQDSYYLYQYSTSVLISCNIVKRLLSNEEGFLDKYIKFLSLGGSTSISEALAYLDIDLKNEEYTDYAFIMLREYINELSGIANRL